MIGSNLQIIYFSIIYCFVFTGYYVTAGFLNIIYPDHAFISFAIFYSAHAIGSLIFPYTNPSKKYFKLELFVSSLGLCIFVGFASSRIIPLLLIGAGIGGLGNSLIWLKQGIYISEFSTSEIGSLTGIFFAIFGSSLIVGNLIGLIIIFASGLVSTMMYVMIGITLIGVIMTLFVKPHKKGDNIDKNTSDSTNTLKTLIALIKCYGYLLIPIMITTAVGLNITYQIIPQSLNMYKNNITNIGNTTNITIGSDIGSNINSNIDLYNLGVFLAYGISSIITSYVSGKLFEHWKLLLILYIFLELLVLGSIIVIRNVIDVDKNIDNTPIGIWIIIGFVKGITDYLLNNILNISISTFYKEDAGPIYGMYRCIYAVSYVIISICTGYLNYNWIIGITVALSIISAVCYIVFRKMILTEKFIHRKIEIEFDIYSFKV